MKILKNCILIFLLLNPFLYPQSDTLKAKIAILSNFGDSLHTLKNYDRVMDNDGFRILIQSYTNCYAYIISSDLTASQLLTNQVISHLLNPFSILKDRPLCLPSTDHFYIFNGEDQKLKISIILSLNPIKEIENIFKGKESINKVDWEEIEKIVFEEQKKIINGNSSKPFSIAGNVSSVNEEFLNKQPVLVGRKILTRTFNIEILKAKK